MESGDTFSGDHALFKTDEIEKTFRIRAFGMPGDLLGIWLESAPETPPVGPQKDKGPLESAATGAQDVAEQADPRGDGQSVSYSSSISP